MIMDPISQISVMRLLSGVKHTPSLSLIPKLRISLREMLSKTQAPKP